MTRANSNDLRLRAARLVAHGHGCRAVAALLEMGVATVVRCSQRYRATGSADARPCGGKRRSSGLERARGWIEARLATPGRQLENQVVLRSWWWVAIGPDRARSQAATPNSSVMKLA